MKPKTSNIEAALKENDVPFVTDDTLTTAITLPGNAFFDQELWDVIFNKLMKAPVKDYQVLLRLSKLWKTINDISKKLSVLRDALAKDCELDEYLNASAPLTAEQLNDPTYQEKSMAFGKLIQEHIFSKYISLAPLWILTLDLSNPDGHARSFLEGSNLSADDVDMLDKLWIVHIVYPETEVPAEASAPAAQAQAIPAEEESEKKTEEVSEEKTDEADDILVPNE